MERTGTHSTVTRLRSPGWICRRKSQSVGGLLAKNNMCCVNRLNKRYDDTGLQGKRIIDDDTMWRPLATICTEILNFYRELEIEGFGFLSNDDAIWALYDLATGKNKTANEYVPSAPWSLNKSRSRIVFVSDEACVSSDGKNVDGGKTLERALQKAGFPRLTLRAFTGSTYVEQFDYLFKQMEEDTFQTNWATTHYPTDGTPGYHQRQVIWANPAVYIIQCSFREVIRDRLENNMYEKSRHNVYEYERNFINHQNGECINLEGGKYLDPKTFNEMFQCVKTTLHNLGQYCSHVILVLGEGDEVNCKGNERYNDIIREFIDALIATDGIFDDCKVIPYLIMSGVDFARQTRPHRVACYGHYRMLKNRQGDYFFDMSDDSINAAVEAFKELWDFISTVCLPKDMFAGWMKVDVSILGASPPGQAEITEAVVNPVFAKKYKGLLNDFTIKHSHHEYQQQDKLPAATGDSEMDDAQEDIHFPEVRYDYYVGFGSKETLFEQYEEKFIPAEEHEER